MMISLIEGLTLVEMTIYGFIGFNMLLSGSFLVQQGFRKFSGAKGE